ncbi:hypothetical protein BBJ28_00003318 [Nothophytophthora sp. Chile5]|nr:hypothetical protein BBJ28_00003318 [Nothophytophthora sp. Chile5]
MAIARCASDLRHQLAAYEGESRMLVKLADTARVVRLLQLTMDSALGILDLLDSPVRDLWHEALQLERNERMELYEALLADDEWLEAEMGYDRQRLEVLTLLRHGLDQHGEVLTSWELDIVSDVYDAVARRSDVVVGKLPNWFTTSEQEWSMAEKTPVERGEESCVRQAAAWAQLHHPNVRKFYGAYHVGEAFVIHGPGRSLATRSVITWSDLLGCAHGLQYVHERGFAHRGSLVTHLFYSDSSKKGFLSGMGLVGCQGVTDDLFLIQDDASEYKHEDTGTPSDYREPSVLSDIRAFGFAIFELRFFDLAGQLPDARPAFVLADEWELLVGMCTFNPAERLSMEDILYRMGVLAQQESLGSTVEDVDALWTIVEDLSEYQIHSLGKSLRATLEEADGLCSSLEEFSDVNRPVLDRLVNVYDQLLAAESPLSLSLVENFSLILLRFFNMLDRRTFSSGSAISTLCESKTVAGKNYNLHHDIDRLLQSSPVLVGSAAIHHWQPIWNRTRQRQREAIQASLEDPTRLLNELVSESDRPGAVALLQFEALNSGISSSVMTLTEAGQGDGEQAAQLPQWFIPPHQVELGRHIADGSFGAVYHALWLGTDVVVKQVLTDQTDERNRLQFRREVDLWFKLNHANLIKLYGACHEGRPFFVCERAMHGTLATFFKGKYRKEIWFSLWDAALGLQHLHDRGIVHGDLKGNNILICDHYKVKLADFGLSIIANRTETPANDANDVQGAVRWKAPECLRGARPTFASDIYSFGMCIIEAVTGQFPWGNSLPDVAVKLNVAKKGILPSRPESFNDAEWELVTRMCRPDPKSRITVGAVVNMAYNLSI